MEDDMEKVAGEEEIAEIRSILDAGEEWIYDEGEEADIATYEVNLLTLLLFQPCFCLLP